MEILKWNSSKRSQVWTGHPWLCVPYSCIIKMASVAKHLRLKHMMEYSGHSSSPVSLKAIVYSLIVNYSMVQLDISEKPSILKFSEINLNRFNWAFLIKVYLKKKATIGKTVKSYRLQWKITDYMYLQVLVVDHNNCISIQNCSYNCH